MKRTFITIISISFNIIIIVVVIIITNMSVIEMHVTNTQRCIEQWRSLYRATQW